MSKEPNHALEGIKSVRAWVGVAAVMVGLPLLVGVIESWKF
jgi:hypothetical protein